MKNLRKHAHRLAAAFRVTDGRSFRLKDFDPADTLGLGAEAKPEASLALREGVQEIARLQDFLYAQDKWAALEKRPQ